MTKEEAKKRWCSFCRCGGSGYNRWPTDADPEGIGKALCIGEKCMHFEFEIVADNGECHYRCSRSSS